MRKLIAAGLLALTLTTGCSQQQAETHPSLAKYPPPAACQTEDEGTLTVYEDGSIRIEETGCILDAETRTWRR